MEAAISIWHFGTEPLRYPKSKSVTAVIRQYTLYANRILDTDPEWPVCRTRNQGIAPGQIGHARGTIESNAKRA